MEYCQDIEYEMDKVIGMSTQDMTEAIKELKKTIICLNNRIEKLESKL